MIVDELDTSTHHIYPNADNVISDLVDSHAAILSVVHFSRFAMTGNSVHR